MKWPCPLPLKDAWSPVGYQVHEVADEVSTATPAPRAARPPEAERSGPAPQRLPFSSMGYQVVPVAEENLPEPPLAEERLPESPRYPVVLPVRPRPHAGIPPAAIWGPCALVACFVVVFLAACALASRSRAPEPNGVAGEVALPRGEIRDGGVIIPQVNAANAPVVLKAKPRARDAVPAQAGEACQPAAPGECETFGTAVQFARNTVEALKAAEQQRKLAFVLHVSGNFEEARFT